MRHDRIIFSLFLNSAAACLKLTNGVTDAKTLRLYATRIQEGLQNALDIDAESFYIATTAERGKLLYRLARSYGLCGHWYEAGENILKALKYAPKDPAVAKFLRRVATEGGFDLGARERTSSLLALAD